MDVGCSFCKGRDKITFVKIRFSYYLVLGQISQPPAHLQQTTGLTMQEQDKFVILLNRTADLFLVHAKTNHSGYLYKQMQNKPVN